ncbi:MAG: tRNA lysidine(34) synthetase TilS [Clostridiaceae bacterium]|nr:tRNA lysidine(34) synthetase TilS [Clostridiaceae bacterium]
MDKFVQKVRQTMEAHHMLETNEPVLAALSGGADSVALLLALTELGIPVSACHLHHGLRGAEADRDEQFCRSLCAKLGIALTVRHADAAAYARKVHESVETAARNLRYAFFAEIADGRKTATAHTADDNLETVLFHLARGSGLDGLCGIPPVREGIVRPLIACTREEVEAFLASRGQEFVTDSTNLQPAYTRNRIRQEVVPVLRALNPQAAETVSALTARLRTDRDYLEEQAQALLSQAAQDGGWRAELLADAHPALRTRALRIACQQSGMPARDFTARHVAALEALLRNPNPSAQIDLPAGFAARREYDLLRVEKKQKPADFEQIPVRIPFDGRLGAGAARVTVRPVQKNQVFYNSFNTFYVGCDTIDIPTFVLRTRRTGDRLRLNRHGGSRPLKKILIDKKIPAPQRGTLAVLADQNGVIAVQSVGTDISRCPGQGGIFEIRFEG